MSNAAKSKRLDAMAVAACAAHVGALELSTTLSDAAHASVSPATQQTLALALAISASASALGMVADLYPLQRSQLSTMPHVVALLRAAADIFEAVEAEARIDG